MPAEVAPRPAAQHSTACFPPFRGRVKGLQALMSMPVCAAQLVLAGKERCAGRVAGSCTAAICMFRAYRVSRRSSISLSASKPRWTRVQQCSRLARASMLLLLHVAVAEPLQCPYVPHFGPSTPPTYQQRSLWQPRQPTADVTPAAAVCSSLCRATMRSLLFAALLLAGASAAGSLGPPDRADRHWAVWEVSLHTARRGAGSGSTETHPHTHAHALTHTPLPLPACLQPPRPTLATPPPARRPTACARPPRRPAVWLPRISPSLCSSL